MGSDSRSGDSRGLTPAPHGDPRRPRSTAQQDTSESKSEARPDSAHREIPLARPNISQAEIDAVVSVLRTPNLSLGPKVGEFERAFAETVGVRHAVAVSSGTAALHLIIRALGLGPGDEVITTPFSFVASANCILYERATPVFADIDPHTWNIDPAKVEAAITLRTRAIIPVDVFGQPADMDAIRDMAKRCGIFVLEDSCEALGATYKGRGAGSLGDAGVFGFYPNKQITTGEGGMITTNDAALADLCRSLRNQGRAAAAPPPAGPSPNAGPFLDAQPGGAQSGNAQPGGAQSGNAQSGNAQPGGAQSGWLSHPRMGFNYRLPDINCALGLAQVRRLDELLAGRARVAKTYVETLTACGLVAPRGGDGAFKTTPRPDTSTQVPLVLQRIGPDVRMSWFVFVVRLADRFSEKDRDGLLGELRSRGIGCSNYFAPIHLQAYFREQFGRKPGDFPICEHVAARTMALPFHHELTREDVEYVCATLREFVG